MNDYMSIYRACRRLLFFFFLSAKIYRYRDNGYIEDGRIKAKQMCFKKAIILPRSLDKMDLGLFHQI